MVRLLPLLLFVSFSVGAANNNDDGFVWVDANTKIKLTPIGSSAGSAAAGGTAPEKAPEQSKKAKKKEKTPK